MTHQPIQLGLVGAGAWGRHFIETVGGLDDVRLRRLASHNPASRDLIERYCTLHESWAEMIEAGGLDGVIIATPPATHAKIAAAALDRDLAVLIEKPLTLDLAEATALRDRARTAGAVALVDHIDLWNPAWQALKKRRAELGRIRTMAGTWASWGPFRPDTAGRWDYGAHALAVCIDLADAEPNHVEARHLSRASGGELVEAVLGWDDGLTATLRFGNASRSKARDLTVQGSAGALRYDDLAAHKAWLNGAAVSYPPARPLAAVVARFVSAIRDQIIDMTSLDLGVGVVATLTRIDRALGIGRT